MARVELVTDFNDCQWPNGDSWARTSVDQTRHRWRFSVLKLRHYTIPSGESYRRLNETAQKVRINPTFTGVDLWHKHIRRVTRSRLPLSPRETPRPRMAESLHRTCSSTHEDEVILASILGGIWQCQLGTYEVKYHSRQHNRITLHIYVGVLGHLQELLPTEFN